MTVGQATIVVPRAWLPAEVREHVVELRALSVLVFLPMPVVGEDGDQTAVRGVVDDVLWNPNARALPKLVELLLKLDVQLDRLATDETATADERAAAEGLLRIANCFGEGQGARPR